jgi:hypothetical protein
MADLSAIGPGADSQVRGSVSDVNHHAQDVFKKLGIQATGSSMKNSGTEQTLTGKKGDLNVEVKMDQAGANQTHVQVVAKEGSLKWNKDYAKNVLAHIIEIG